MPVELVRCCILIEGHMGDRLSHSRSEKVQVLEVSQGSRASWRRKAGRQKGRHVATSTRLNLDVSLLFSSRACL